MLAEMIAVDEIERELKDGLIDRANPNTDPGWLLVVLHQ